MNENPVTIIIPTYNASGSIRRTLLSVLDGLYCKEFEILVIDDCSDDNTIEIVKEFSEKYGNIKLIILKNNTGSPSTPRNIGIEKAGGEYITFLDDDDTIEPDRLYNAYLYAKENDFDYLKGYMKIIKNGGMQDICRLDVNLLNPQNIMSEFIANTSTNICMLVKRNFLLQNNIRFDGNFKIGEDTVFTTEVFSHNPKAGYIDDYFYYYNKKSGIDNVSSTQSYGDKELNDHIEAWKRAEEHLNKVNMSYYQLRLPVAVKNTLISIVSYSKGAISENTFNKFRDFISINKECIKDKIILHKRFQEVLDAVVTGDYQLFLYVSKRRLLISGYDLKFIQPIEKYLKKEYNVKIDKWSGHNKHNKKASVKLLNWADIIFCEWMLGNSVWYSKRKMNFQTLIVRAHRFEIDREYGFDIDFTNVDAVIAVSYYYVEEFGKKFKIPKSKMYLLSNYIDENIYKGIKNKNTRYNIGIAGIIPARKGFHRGLELLKSLREKNNNFKLIIIGNDYKSVNWLVKNPKENEYFKNCERYIIENNLKDNIEFTGFIDRSKMFENVKFILSLSDSETPESFHLAPAEALADSTLALVLRWNGAEYIYPESIIFNSLEEIEELITKTCKDEKLYNKILIENRDFILKNYNIQLFLEQLNQIIEKTLLSK